MSRDQSHHCQQCNRYFGSAEGLAQHSRVPRHGFGHGCTACKRSFKTREALEQHLGSPAHASLHNKPRQQSIEQPQQSPAPAQFYQCSQCERRFGTQESLSQHVNSAVHAPAPVHECTECGIRFRSLLALDSHLDSHLHNSVTLVQSQTSMEHKLSNSSDHQAQDQQNNSISAKKSSAHRCIECNRSFTSKQALKQHRKDSPAHMQRLHECVECALRFGSLQELNGHLGSPAHVLVNEWTVAEQEINHLQDLVDQIDSLALASESAAPHQCFECDEAFSSAEELDEHLRSPAHVLSFKGNRWFMYPALHRIISQSVDSSIPAPWFNREDTTEDQYQEYETNIVGAFRCSKRKRCGHRWTSGYVCTWIRGFPDNGYNAVVYNQMCLKCGAIGQLDIDHDSYVDRVSRRLNIWNGVSTGPAPRSDRITEPHEENHCAGCQAGHCLRGRRMRGSRR